MYGILAGCIAMMALFLGLFAISVEPMADDDFGVTQQSAQVQTVVSDAETGIR